MLWGKLIDHDRCIGCHACSVACKVENQVPLGVFRTWVKQVEKGSDLSARRHFGVLRCNQCDDAPCVGICPTRAMHRRPDGIVDFDPEVCVGCKACILACPYDAIYIDPDQGTAAKCNFCAHRIEVGLEPACVSACPTSALVVSDLQDPTSPVAVAVARQGVSVRKPELGTLPKVFYKGADQSVLDPHAASRPALGVWGGSREVEPESEPKPGGPRLRGAPAAARVAYDVPRDGSPWGWKVSGYLLAKGIGGGALLVGGLVALFVDHLALGFWPALLGVLGVALATLLLIADLRRPERFMLLITRPHWNSWLVKGAWVLMAASVIGAAWGFLWMRWGVGPDAAAIPRGGWQLVGLLAALAGAAAAGYTAFLFAQARGRALWQSPLLLPHLLVQALVCGSAALAFVPGLPDGPRLFLGAILAAALALDLPMVLAELRGHGNEDVRVATRWLQDGRQSASLWLGVIAMGHIFPGVALAAAFMLGEPDAVLLAGLAAIAGVALWDHLFVQAGQVPPLS